MTNIPHTAVIDIEAAILAAESIAFLMQPDIDSHHFEHFIELLCSYFHGKGGDTPTKSDLRQAENIQKAYKDWLTRQVAGKVIRKRSILAATIAVYGTIRKITLTGSPDKDWFAIRRVLEKGPCSRLRELAREARNIRLLERGAQIRQELSQDWLDNGYYTNALRIIQRAFVREHFSTNSKPESGVVVMNMHKAKGKQFDEVIIFEGWPIKRKGQPPYNADRIVRYNSRKYDSDQARQNFRVSVTRAKFNTTILTPKNDPCILLISEDR
jgi:DNA helicase-2/ATP-dependent DNA helicase PcrA